jgi:Fe-coproporphyrin III synthase
MMPLTIFKRILNFTTHRIHNLPVLVLMPHSRCNCRCVMCDIWKANHDKKEISVETLRNHIQSFKKLGVREIVFSGGEALMHSNLWEFSSLLSAEKIKLTLLSTGLLLAKHANSIVKNLNGVIVSLDGSRLIHDHIRQVPNGFDKLAEGVKALKSIDLKFPVTARCVLQRNNYADFFNIVMSAKNIGFDQISFLTADVSSSAFNRLDPWVSERVSEISLDSSQTEQFEKIIEESFVELSQEYKSKFIAENPAKMRKLVQYYKAINRESDFPHTVCNAPWVSAVIESDGSVLPCFFHKPYGNIYQKDFLSIINSKEAVNFRKNLDMSRDETCKKCVCSLKLGLTGMN